MAGKANNKNFYVCKIDDKQVAQLEEYLRDRGWKFGDMQYAHWKASMEKTNVVAYKSGKLTVQGKGTEDFVVYILEPEILKTVGFGYEDILNTDADAGAVTSVKEPFKPHGGVDESGKGDFFGPLVIASVFADDETAENLLKIGVKDSKVIKSPAKIRDMASKIRRSVNDNFSIVAIGPEAYNRLYGQFKNLNRLLAWGHARAIENLLEKAPQCNDVLSDKFGAEHLIKNALQQRGRGITLRQQTKAESDVAVAAASILARDMFVRGMDKLSQEAGLELPKGASKKVQERAIQLARRDGPEALGKYAKLHFKTYQSVLDALK
ncbi:MAG: ribonuclease HIII [Lentisphaerae bacterium]|nr:ribonuclease HIII [Lentisphaerota bacterium]MCP4102290.1 ribonuclease HIII [Lentisphaerota bacterium]